MNLRSADEVSFWRTRHYALGRVRARIVSRSVTILGKSISITTSAYARYKLEIVFDLWLVVATMIIRESPTPTSNSTSYTGHENLGRIKRGSESQKDVSWPPKSPREALASSPSGRKRLQRDCDSGSGSSTPSKRPRIAGALCGNALVPRSNRVKLDTLDEGDEETLQLQLQEIQARLQLKKLQKSKRKYGPGHSASEENIRPSGREDTRLDKPLKASHVARPTQPDVLVVHSPKRREIQAQPESPRRVQLGIDKGLKASEVSLKRARSQHHRLQSITKTSGPYQSKDNAQHDPLSHSFGERLARARHTDVSKQARQQQVRKSRSQGFSIGSQCNLKQPAAEEPQTSSMRVPLQPSASERALKRRAGPESYSSHYQSKTEDSSDHSGTPKDQVDTESFSNFRLSKRRARHAALADAFKGKELYPIPRLLKEVVAPEYEPPDVEDFVVLGIIASKSSPYDHAPAGKIVSTADPSNPSTGPQASRFMVVHLTDLAWELDMFLFGSAYDAFWKLAVGTVVAILNPGLMPPRPHLRDSGKFSLKLGSSEDTVLDIGSSADLGFCKSIKRDGKECMAWIDHRKTDFCDFHVNLQVEKSRAGRMEINTMCGLNLFTRRPGSNEASRGRVGKGRGGSRIASREGGRRKDDDLKREGRYFDLEAHETAWIVPPELQGCLNTRQLLDAEDYGPDGRLSAAERSRKRLAEHERERELAKELGFQGHSLGGEYLRLKSKESRHQENSTESMAADYSRKPEDALDAKALDLIGSKSKVRLNPPTKDRVLGKVKGRASDARGWGGAFKRGLLSPPQSTRAVENSSNFDAGLSGTSNRKTRLMLEAKGVRTSSQRILSSDTHVDEDGLDIV